MRTIGSWMQRQGCHQEPGTKCLGSAALVAPASQPAATLWFRPCSHWDELSGPSRGQGINLRRRRGRTLAWMVRGNAGNGGSSNQAGAEAAQTAGDTAALR